MMAPSLALLSCTFFVSAVILACQVEAEQQFFRYETVARSLDDGWKSMNEIKGSAVDSQQGSHFFRKTFSGPSRHYYKPNSIGFKHRHKISSNTFVSHDSSSYKINGKEMSPEEAKEFEESFMRELASHGGVRRGFIKRSNIRPRTVESPALSVDSGGRSSATSSLANAISKAFRVEQGHYSDIYDRIDNHKPLSTKRPAELIDETIGNVLVSPRGREKGRATTAGLPRRDDQPPLA